MTRAAKHRVRLEWEIRDVPAAVYNRISMAIASADYDIGAECSVKVWRNGKRIMLRDIFAEAGEDAVREDRNHR